MHATKLNYNNQNYETLREDIRKLIKNKILKNGISDGINENSFLS